MTEDHLEATISLRGVLFSPGSDVLLVKRASDDGWELPGGRIGTQEDAPTGVHREIEEETGLDVDVGRPVHAASWRNETDRGRFAVYYWCAVSEGQAATDGDPAADRPTVTLSHEHVEYEWLAPETATERLTDVQTTAVTAATEVYGP
ncbi:NUDIX hydrolase [Halobellus rufus]|uniref:NUDIX hydrolase n=1 Tax=Halobellus rufus TaxID=1448860 RepID=UPI0006790476|nr:NUDIX hydrolase [Halobellus rufus]